MIGLNLRPSSGLYPYEYKILLKDNKHNEQNKQAIKYPIFKIYVSLYSKNNTNSYAWKKLPARILKC